MYVQERSPKVAERQVLALHAPSDYGYLNPSHQSGSQEGYGRVARSALPRSPDVYVFALAVLSGREIMNERRP